ncbi:MAG: hypothetical protein R2792_14945 [Saprospiraceae bacterium]
MKKLFLVFSLLLVCLLGPRVQAQNPSSNSGLQLSLHGGYDHPFFQNNTPYIKYKGGLYLGSSLDYYWMWFGLGADVDYFRSQPRSTYPTANLVWSGTPLNTFVLQEGRVDRLFYGIGPNFRAMNNSVLSMDFKLRGGIASIKGGNVLHQAVTGTPPPLDLNFHAGYDLKAVPSVKA